MRWAFQVAYLGGEYSGYARQPGRRTVEGDLLGILQRNGWLRESGGRFQAASRTDRGVSALGNVVALNTEASPREIIADVNGEPGPLWFHGYASVPDSFNPRHARERWYRYLLPPNLDRDRLGKASRVLLGRHAFRGLSQGQDGVSDVASIQFTSASSWTAMDIRADRFLWTMVRRIAQALRLHAEGSLSLPLLVRARDEKTAAIGPAPAEPLFLMDVSYGFPFRRFSPAGTQVDVASRRERREMEAALISLLQERLRS